MDFFANSLLFKQTDATPFLNGNASMFASNEEDPYITLKEVGWNELSSTPPDY
jgi:hypothetical protein